MKIGIAIVAVALAAAPAFAQTDVPASSGNGKLVPGASGTAAGSTESLSTKLNKSDGVITPKADVDPRHQGSRARPASKFDPGDTALGDRRKFREVRRSTA